MTRFSKLSRLIFPLGLTFMLFAVTAQAAGQFTPAAPEMAPTAVHNMVTRTVTLTPAKDNTLFDNNSGSTSNGAGVYFYAGRTAQPNGFLRRGILAFDIPNQLPTDATIVTASLALYVSKQSSGASMPYDFSLHRLESDWGEGSSDAGENGGGGALATANDATWLHTFYTTTLWSTAGGDFVITPTATTAVDGIGSFAWSSASLVSDIQSWAAGDTNDYGWALIGDEANGSSAKQFNSRENGNAVTRPQLTITYQFTPTVPSNVVINGSEEGIVNTSYAFTATVVPTTTSTPITYTWTADDQTAIVITNSTSLENSVSYSWPTTGTKTITVTADNTFGTVTQTHLINLATPISETVGVDALSISGPMTGTINTDYDFDLTAAPISATTPITYFIQATDQTPLTLTADLTESVRFNWSQTGQKTITVTADNGYGSATNSWTITIAEEPASQWALFLPLINQ